MYADTSYPVKYNVTISMNITSDPHILHANVHSCRQESGMCTPLVAATPGLVTHTTAKTATLAQNFTSFAADVILTSGRWTVICHVRFVSQGNLQYDVAIGFPRTVIDKEFELMTTASSYNAVVSGAAVVLCVISVVFFLVFWYRRSPTIKSASPSFCLVIIAHAGLGVITVFFLHQATDSYCMIRPWLLSISFSGMFGLLAAKTWRIKKIFGQKRFAIVRISNSRLWMIYGILVLIDVVVMSVWTSYDPMRAKVVWSTSRTGAYEVACDSSTASTFITFLFSYKGAILLAGVYLAWATRNVATLFNESKLISLSLWTIALLCVIAVPLQYLIKDQPDIVYTIRAFAIEIVILSVVLILFAPKFITVFTHGDQSVMVDTAKATKYSVHPEETSTSKRGDSTPIVQGRSHSTRLTNEMINSLEELSRLIQTMLTNNCTTGKCVDGEIADLQQRLDSVSDMLQFRRGSRPRPSRQSTENLNMLKVPNSLPTSPNPMNSTISSIPSMA